MNCSVCGKSLSRPGEYIMDNSTASGWTCTYCGTFVYPGLFHACPPGTPWNPTFACQKLIKRTTTERYDSNGLLIEKIVVLEEGL